MRLEDSAHADLFECADLAANLPKDGTSAVYREINPDWRWTLDAHLAAIQADALHVLVWSKTKDAERHSPRNYPKRIPRPGLEETPKTQDRFEEVEGLPKDEFMSWMDQAGIKQAV